MLVRTTRMIRAEESLCAGLLLVVVLLSSVGPLRAGDPGPIAWRGRYEAAQAEARARNRPLWVQFTGPWCLSCRRMDREVFSRFEVVALSRDDFVPVKVRSDEREDLLALFGVTCVPTTILVAPGGQVLGRQEGYLDSGAFLGFLASARPARGLDPSSRPGIALAGYDPVNLVRGHGLAAGKPALAVRFDGQEYRFADPNGREQFLKEPERFLPCGGGICPVTLLERGVSQAGDPRFGVYYRGHIYLCADEAARQRFAREPERFANADLGDGGHCPHCRGQVNRPVPGSPQFTTIYRGRRYLFPDAEHRAAFRASPEMYLR